MKITSIDVYLLDAGNQREYRRPVVCRVHTDEDIFGDGEAGIPYGIGAPGAFGMLEDIAHLAIGMNPMENEVIWSKMFKASSWGLGGGAIVFAGISAIDMAIWDIRGKKLGVPVYELLGGKFRSELRTYASQLQFGWDDKIGPWKTPEEYAAITQYALDQGYDCVKIDFTQIAPDGNRLPKHDVEGIPTPKVMKMLDDRMNAVRSTCGWNFDLMVECHSRTDAISAVMLGQLCDKYKCMVIEEPTIPMNPLMDKAVHEKIKTPIATGERMYGRWSYLGHFLNNAIQLAQPDISNCGGITEVKKICDMAEVFDVTMQIHCSGGPLSTAAGLQLEAAIPNFCIHEHHFRSTQPDIRKLCKYDYQPINGVYHIPDLPGLGNETSDWAIEHALKHTEITSAKRGLNG